MSEEAKWLTGIGVGTVLILGAIIYFNSGANPGVTIDPAILVRSDSQAIIASGAKVTVVEFGDYQCPACAATQPVVKLAQQQYQGKINFVFRNFPLPQHQYAVISSEAAEIAGDQGKYWEMNEILYAKQNDWVASADPKPLFIQYAKDLGMDVTVFTSSLNANKYADKIARDQNDGNAVGVNATPTFFINGKSLILNSNGDLNAAIDVALAASKG